MQAKARKILIADDEPDILEIVSFNLQAEGYEVFTAKNGNEAIEIAKKTRFKKKEFNFFCKSRFKMVQDFVVSVPLLHGCYFSFDLFN